MDFYAENGPSTAFAGELLTPETSIFHLEGFYALLVAQRVPHRQHRPLSRRSALPSNAR